MKKFIKSMRYIAKEYPMTWESSKRNRRIMLRYFLYDESTPALVWNA